MAKGKITITGIPEKEPRIHENGKVTLIFKMESSTTLPNGLDPLKNCPCLVHVAPKTWKSVATHWKPESKLFVQGEVKASVNKKGVAFLEVVALDIGLMEKKDGPNGAPKQAKAPPQKQSRLRGIETPKGTQEIVERAQITIPEHFTPPSPEAIKEVVAYVEAHHTFDKPLLVQKETHVLLDGYKLYLAAQELHIERVPITYTTELSPGRSPQRARDISPPAGNDWYEAEQVFQVAVQDILLTEPIHSQAKEISLPHKLAWYAEHTDEYEQRRPVVVRRLEDGKYSLVTGIRGYFVAKILGWEQIPAIETDLSHDAFMRVMGWREGATLVRGNRGKK